MISTSGFRIIYAPLAPNVNRLPDLEEWVSLIESATAASPVKLLSECSGVANENRELSLLFWGFDIEKVRRSLVFIGAKVSRFKSLEEEVFEKPF